MMKYIYCTDFHGFGQPIIDKIEDTIDNIEGDYRLILGGDYIDRGQYSKLTLDWAMEMEKLGAVCLLGNHEDMFTEFYESDDFHTQLIYLRNGGDEFINELIGCDNIVELLIYNHREYNIIKDEIKVASRKYYEWMKTLTSIYSTDNIVFVHAGLNLDTEDPILMTSKEDSLWIRDKYIYDNLHFRRNPMEYMIVSGHTPTNYINIDKDDNGVREIKNVIVSQYEGEYPRVFADTGMSNNQLGNVLIIDENGMDIEVL